MIAVDERGRGLFEWRGEWGTPAPGVVVEPEEPGGAFEVVCLLHFLPIPGYARVVVAPAQVAEKAGT